MTESEPLDRVTVRADTFDGKPVMCDMRIAVEYPVLEAEDMRAFLLSAHRAIAVRRADRNVNRTESGSTPAVIAGRTRTRWVCL